MKKRSYNKISLNVKDRAYDFIEKKIYIHHIGPKLIAPWMLSLISPDKPEHANVKLIKNLLQEEEE